MTKFIATIQKIVDEASEVKTFVLTKPDDFTFEPGQYCWLSLSELDDRAPMAIASGSSQPTLQFSVRAWGDLTNALFAKSVGDAVEIDGPYGSAFPVDVVSSDTTLHLIAGGTGITPIRSLTYSLVGTGTKNVYYGAKLPEELLYFDELHNWDANIELTVDQEVEGWSGRVGLVTELLKEVDFGDSDLFFVCGPKPMEAAIVDYLRSLNISEDKIFVSLEKFDEEGNVVGPVLPVTAEEVEF